MSLKCLILCTALFSPFCISSGLLMSLSVTTAFLSFLSSHLNIFLFYICNSCSSFMLSQVILIQISSGFSIWFVLMCHDQIHYASFTKLLPFWVLIIISQSVLGYHFISINNTNLIWFCNSKITLSLSFLLPFGSFAERAYPCTESVEFKIYIQVHCKAELKIFWYSSCSLFLNFCPIVKHNAE